MNQLEERLIELINKQADEDSDMTYEELLEMVEKFYQVILYQNFFDDKKKNLHFLMACELIGQARTTMKIGAL